MDDQVFQCLFEGLVFYNNGYIILVLLPQLLVLFEEGLFVLEQLVVDRKFVGEDVSEMIGGEVMVVLVGDDGVVVGVDIALIDESGEGQIENGGQVGQCFRGVCVSEVVVGLGDGQHTVMIDGSFIVDICQYLVNDIFERLQMM